MSASIVYYILSVIKLRYFSAENAILFFSKISIQKRYILK